MIDYLRLQIEAGAQAVQIFDSWVGLLAPEDYERFALRWVRGIVDGVRDLGRAGDLLRQRRAAPARRPRPRGADVLGLCWRTPLDEAAARVGPDVALQGNLDPHALFADRRRCARLADDVLARMAGRPGHIMNLGHGILPDTPIASVEALVAAVHATGAARERRVNAVNDADAARRRSTNCWRGTIGRARATRPTRPRWSSTTASMPASTPAAWRGRTRRRRSRCRSTCTCRSARSAAPICGCNVVITKHRDVAAQYLDYLDREIDMLAAHLPAAPHLAAALGRRHAHLLHGSAAGARLRAADASLHVHAGRRDRRRDRPAGDVHGAARPRSGGSASTACRWACRTSRPRCRRPSTASRATSRPRRWWTHARAQGFRSINIDLIYGLPYQTIDGFSRTLDQVLTLRPERVAVYSFAFVPWMKAHMKHLPEDVAAGARAEDRAARRWRSARSSAPATARSAWTTSRCPRTSSAARWRARTLHRNFMGYTVQSARDMVALGVSAIGDVQGTFVQNTKKLNEYYAALDAGPLPDRARLRAGRGRPHSSSCDHRADVQRLPGRAPRRNRGSASGSTTTSPRNWRSSPARTRLPPTAWCRWTMWRSR